MTKAEVRSRLTQLSEDDNTGEESEIKYKEKIKTNKRKGHLMVWGYNSNLLNYGHLLLTGNSVNDETLYFVTPKKK